MQNKPGSHDVPAVAGAVLQLGIGPLVLLVSLFVLFVLLRLPLMLLRVLLSGHDTAPSAAQRTRRQVASVRLTHTSYRWGSAR